MENKGTKESIKKTAIEAQQLRRYIKQNSAEKNGEQNTERNYGSTAVHLQHQQRYVVRRTSSKVVRHSVESSRCVGAGGRMGVLSRWSSYPNRGKPLPKSQEPVTSQILPKTRPGLIGRACTTLSPIGRPSRAQIAWPGPWPCCSGSPTTFVQGFIRKSCPCQEPPKSFPQTISTQTPKNRSRLFVAQSPHS